METSTKQGNVSCKKKKKIPPSLPPLKTKNQKTEHKDPLGVVRLLGGMLLVKMGKGAGMQEYKGETVGRRQPSLLGCRNATERRGEGMRSETERGWSRWWSGRGGGVFYLKVDSLYTGGWMGDELRGRKGGRQSNRGGGEGDFTGEGGAWLKESTPMETNKILVLNFSFCLFVCMVLYLFSLYI